MAERGGGIEADLTIARLSSDAFMVVTSSATVFARSSPWWRTPHAGGAATAVADGLDVRGGLSRRDGASVRRELLPCLVDVPPPATTAFPRTAPGARVEIGYAVGPRATASPTWGELGVGSCIVPADMAAARVPTRLIERGGDDPACGCAAATLWTGCRMGKRAIAISRATTSRGPITFSRPASASP
jgi:hypothetical protein